MDRSQRVGPRHHAAPAVRAPRRADRVPAQSPARQVLRRDAQADRGTPATRTALEHVPRILSVQARGRPRLRDRRGNADPGEVEGEPAADVRDRRAGGCGPRTARHAGDDDLRRPGYRQGTPRSRTSTSPRRSSRTGSRSPGMAVSRSSRTGPRSGDCLRRPTETAHVNLWLGSAFNALPSAGFVGRVTLHVQLDDDQQPSGKDVADCTLDCYGLAESIASPIELFSLLSGAAEASGSGNPLRVIVDDTLGLSRLGAIRFDRLAIGPFPMRRSGPTPTARTKTTAQLCAEAAGKPKPLAAASASARGCAQDAGHRHADEGAGFRVGLPSACPHPDHPIASASVDSTRSRRLARRRFATSSSAPGTRRSD